MSNTVLVVDVSHIFFPIFEVAARDGEEKFAAARAFEAMGALALGGADVARPVLVAVDSPPYIRGDVFPGYKQNRKPKREGYDAAMESFLLALAADEDYQLLAEKGYEADDICASVAYQCRLAGVDVVVATRDKDLFQLVRDRKGETPYCEVYSTGSQLFFNEERAEKSMGVHPSQVRDYLSLLGDASDGIPGVPGVGEVKAKLLIKKYGALAGILAASLDELTEDVGAKAAEALKSKEGQAAAWMAHSLVGLNSSLDLKLRLPEPSRIPEKKAEETVSIVRSVSQLARDEDEGPVTPREIQFVPKVSSVTVATKPQLQGMMNLETLQMLGMMASRFWKSGLYKRFGNEDGVFAVMATGIEMGIQPVSSLGLFHIIEGKVSPSAHVLVALAKASPECVSLECIKESDTGVTYSVVKRSGFAAEFTYTQADAKRDQMKWANGGKNFRAMMRKTAGAQAARLWFPEALHGLYAAEEMGHQVEDSV